MDFRQNGKTMLVRFNSDAGAIIMFGDVAVKLLKMMGQTGDIPGALIAADIPPALERLRNAVATHPEAEVPAASGDGDEEKEKEPPVSLRHRAYPLIDLLARAAEKGSHVVWEQARSPLI
jgi:hypothetical protein